jgi:transglutaminase-like putative cysteine protease
MNRSAGRRIGGMAISAPRLVMSWEDWLTFAAALITFLSIAVSLDQANWVRNMPGLVPTAMFGLLIGMIAARIRFPAVGIHPVALALGAVIVVLTVQSYADGVTVGERLGDFRMRMHEWFDIVRAGDISNDNLPFVTLVHGVCFLSAYLAAWSIYRWHNAWIAVLPGGVVLLTNISFLRGQPSGAFVVFLFGAILLVGRMHLQRSQLAWKRHGIEYPDWISLSAAQLTVVMSLGLIIAAWTVPLGSQADAVKGTLDWVAQPVSGQSGTFARLFHNVTSQKGAKLHTFGDALFIQGNVKLGTKPLAEVNATQPGLVRATSYDYYTGTGWKVTGRNSDRRPAGELTTPDASAIYESRVVSILKVKVLDGESVVLSAGTPLATNVSANVETPKGFDGDIERIESRRGLNAGDTYNSIGSESTATAEQLHAAGTDYPDWVKQRYLQVPKNLPQRVRDETQRVAGGATTPYGKAEAIEEYLRTFPYDLAVESPPAGRDTVDFLLFDLKRGYFDYQSTAMAVMLRTVGIPARVAVGYVLDPANAEETRYTIKKDAAYSWVEVFFPKYGWVNFNPTQDRPAGGAGGAISGAAFENPDIPSLDNLFGDDLEKPIPDNITGALNETPVQTGQPPWTLIWSLVAALVVVAATFLAGRLTWNWGLGGLDARGRLWAKTQRLGRWARLGPAPAETAREWSRRMGDTIAMPDDAGRLADAYEEARYGRPDLQRVDDAEASSAYVRLRNTLLGTILRRGRPPAKR